MTKDAKTDIGNKPLQKRMEERLNGAPAPAAIPADVSAARLKALYPQIGSVMPLSYVNAPLTPEEAERLAKAERSVASRRK